MQRRVPEEPADAQGFHQRGNRYSRNGAYDRAIQDYNRAIELDDSFAEAYYDRGFSFYELGRYDEAIADLTRAIELNPEADHYYGQRSLVYLFADRPGLGGGRPGEVRRVEIPGRVNSAASQKVSLAAAVSYYYYMGDGTARSKIFLRHPVPHRTQDIRPTRSQDVQPRVGGRSRPVYGVVGKRAVIPTWCLSPRSR